NIYRMTHAGVQSCRHQLLRVFLWTQLCFTAQLARSKIGTDAGICPETKKHQKRGWHPHPQRRVKTLRMPRPGSPGEGRDDRAPDRQQQPVRRAAHLAPKIGKRMDSKPKERNAAVKHT